VLHEITFKNAVRVTKTLTFYERVETAVKAVVVTEGAGQRFVQERLRPHLCYMSFMY